MSTGIQERPEARHRKRWAIAGTCVALGLVGLGMRSLGGIEVGKRLQESVGINLNEQSQSVAMQAPAPGPSGYLTTQVDLALKRIQKATLILEVDDPNALRREVDAAAGSLGGYVASSRSANGGSQGEVGMNLQIPSGRFMEALNRFEGMGKVLSLSRSEEDITRAYVDLEARLRNKRVSQARLREILATRTGKIADVVEAEQALSGVTEEIERMEAQRRTYDHEVAFGVLDLTLRPRPVLAQSPPWWTPVKEGARASLEALLGSAIGLLQFASLLLPWALVAAPLILWIRKRIRLNPPLPSPSQP